jgi:phosphotransferase system enzyme I (PtsI)
VTDGTVLTGRAASPGVALAPAFVVAERPAVAVDRPRGTPEQEQARAAEALEATEEALYELSERVAGDAGEEEAAIFAAHADFAADPELMGRVKAGTRSGQSAEQAVAEAFGSFRALLAASADEYLSARAADLDDVRDQVLARLAGQAEEAVPDTRVIAVAHDLTPSQTARMPRDRLAGIACETGSPTSHAAILARALGIPAVMGISGLLGAAAPGAVLALDGSAGEVIVGPDQTQRALVEARIVQEERSRAQLAELTGEPGQTADGRRVELAANVNDPDALDQAAASGAEGSGLVRTEFLFLGATEPPTVEEQTAFYRRVLAAFPGQRVVFRTLDIGADKPVPYISRVEENPALGLRGLRLGLAMPDLLTGQLRALVRAGGEPGSGRLAVMFPMVSRPDELDEVLALVDQICADEGVERPEMGVMVEVPSAALAARRMAARVEFLSLGTNDLLQYLFAADRLLADVAHLPELLDPDVLGLLLQIAEAAHAESAWVGVCGESAADPVCAAALVGLGFDELSMTPMAIPRVKHTLRGVDSADLEKAARAAIAAADAGEARQILQGVL